MAVETGRPSQFKQKSRKNKKAWRKNIDLQDVESHLEDKAESEIYLGTQTPLFSEDRAGSEDQQLKPEKRLKSHEILNARSEVPALVNYSRRPDKKKQKVDRQLLKVLERAGFTNKSKSEAILEKDGNVKVGNLTDLWGDDSMATNTSDYRVDRANKVSTNHKSKQPEAPEPNTPAVALPEAGQSYNPRLEDWKLAVQSAYDGIAEEEAKAQKLLEEQARIDAIIAETEAKMDESDDSASDAEPFNLDSTNLSVNPPASNKRKTRTERNKEKRHREFLAQKAKLKELKLQKSFIKDMKQDAKQRNDSASKEPKKLVRAHSNHPMVEKPLAIKLSDELDDSMRTLKPEGNLLKERLRSLQARGLVEARVPQRKPKRRFKMVEKHSYKHFE